MDRYVQTVVFRLHDKPLLGKLWFGMVGLSASSGLPQRPEQNKNVHTSEAKSTNIFEVWNLMGQHHSSIQPRPRDFPTSFSKMSVLCRGGVFLRGGRMTGCFAYRRGIIFLENIWLGEPGHLSMATVRGSQRQRPSAKAGEANSAKCSKCVLPRATGTISKSLSGTMPSVSGAMRHCQV